MSQIISSITCKCWRSCSQILPFPIARKEKSASHRARALSFCHLAKNIFSFPQLHSSSLSVWYRVAENASNFQKHQYNLYQDVSILSSIVLSQIWIILKNISLHMFYRYLFWTFCPIALFSSSGCSITISFSLLEHNSVASCFFHSQLKFLCYINFIIYITLHQLFVVFFIKPVF